MRTVMAIGGLGVLGVTLACGGVTNLGGLGSGEPLYGSTDLAAGFAEVEVAVSAGGNMDVAELPGVPDTCRGHISPSQPDYRVNASGVLPELRVGACSDSDTTLVVRDPSGMITCVDDAEGSNPVVEFKAAAAGTYDIWVGTYSGGSTSDTILRVTEAEGGICARVNADGPTTNPDITVSRPFGATEVEVTGGGSVSASSLADMPSSGCNGNIDGDGPTLHLQVTGDGPLHIANCSSDDTSLVMRGPDGTWHCDDDTENLNPVIGIPRAPAGQYDVFVGRFSGGTGQSTLHVSESAGTFCSSGSGK